MLIIWPKVRGFLELEKFVESANSCATERVNAPVKGLLSNKKKVTKIIFIENGIAEKRSAFNDAMPVLSDST